MLAYLFWHWREPAVAREEYEAGLLAFHEALNLRGSPGFLGSAVYAVAGAPWLGGAAGYEAR